MLYQFFATGFAKASKDFYMRALFESCAGCNGFTDRHLCHASVAITTPVIFDRLLALTPRERVVKEYMEKLKAADQLGTHAVVFFVKDPFQELRFNTLLRTRCIDAVVLDRREEGSDGESIAYSSDSSRSASPLTY